MVDTNSIVADTNAKIMAIFTGNNWLNIGGWIVAILLLAGGGFWAYLYYKNKKLFNKTITAHAQVGKFWRRAYTDTAKTVKIGKGGFEILYLKKLKTWKIAYGGNFGDNHYDFYVMPDGYWYNGRQYGDVKHFHATKGLTSVVTTNPLMRGQYTALETQIDSMHENKGKFWDKYGSWILSIAFILIAGVMLWLNYKEYVQAMGSLNNLVDKIGGLIDRVNILEGNTGGGSSGLVPV